YEPYLHHGRLELIRGGTQPYFPSDFASDSAMPMRPLSAMRASGVSDPQDRTDSATCTGSSSSSSADMLANRLTGVCNFSHSLPPRKAGYIPRIHDCRKLRRRSAAGSDSS